ncbi:unnamed protein product, partial [Chrysoparadoxa australica]
ELGALAKGSYDVITIENASFLEEGLLGAALACLRPGGKAVITTAGGESSESALCSKLTLAGFMGAKVLEGGAVTAEKPEWEVGASASISLGGADVNDSSKKGAAWKLALDDVADADLVDEGDLLAQDEAPLPKKRESDEPGGCATKKRACKDCSCGRLEMEQAGVDPAEVDVPASSCGSCYKGDAFRCATCPYLGQPAFEKGQEKVMLQGLSLDADV